MLFTPKLIAPNREGGHIVLNSGGALGQPIGVIPRAFCAFRRVRLQGPGRTAIRAAKMKAEREARPSDNRFRIIAEKDGKHAGIWSYDANYELGIRTLPESLCVAPKQDGVRVLNCVEGVEAQVWNNGALIASRWWQSVPNEQQWQSFLRVAADHLDGTVPDSPTVEDPIYRSDLAPISIDSRRLENLLTPLNVASIGLLIGACFFSYLGVQHVRYQYEYAQTEGKKTAASQEVRQILSKRREAFAIASELKNYSQLNSTDHLLSGLHGLTSVLKGQDLKIRTVRLEDGDVEFRLTGESSIEGPELVNALEATDALTSVNISSDRQKSLIVKARLSLKASPALTGVTP